MGPLGPSGPNGTEDDDFEPIRIPVRHPVGGSRTPSLLALPISFGQRPKEIHRSFHGYGWPGIKAGMANSPSTTPLARALHHRSMTKTLQHFLGWLSGTGLILASATAAKGLIAKAILSANKSWRTRILQVWRGELYCISG